MNPSGRASSCGARAARFGGRVWIGAARRASTILLIVCAVLWLLALLMQAGVASRQETWAGPFVTEAPESPLIVFKLGRLRPLPGLTNTGGDDLDNPFRSNIAVTVAGQRWEAGHTPHAELRAGRTRAFSHWGDDLYLALPPGLANQPLLVTAGYTLQPRSWVARTLLFAVALLGVLRIRIALVDRGWRSFARWLMAIRRTAGVAGVVLAGLALTIYAVAILYGWIAGYALPTVALFDVFPAMRRLSLWEPNTPNALYAVAGVGAIVEWLIRLGEGRSRTERLDSSRTKQGARLALLFGAAFLTLLFMMSNGGWRGVMNPADMNLLSIAGLLPNSDAGSYFFATADLSVDGHWNPVASQRPIAAAIRTGIVAVGGTYVASLVLQAALLALCASIAMIGVAEILGVWSAMAFAGLLLGLERPYVTTTMTETLGLGVAVLSAPFLLRGLRDQSYGPALTAFGLITTALLTRMGSMFTLPFLAAWVVFLGVRGGAGRAALAGVAVVGAGLWFVQLTLLHLFGTAQLGIGGDFSFVLCGLATGVNWRQCYLSEVAKGNFWLRPVSADLYAAAWQAYLADPTVMAGSLVRNASDYIANLPTLLFRQYRNVAPIRSEWVELGVAGPIIVVIARLKTPFYARALAFFVLLYLTTVASAAFIYDADGRRTMIVTHLLLSLGLALGFALPDAPWPTVHQARGRSALYVIPVLLLVFGIPALVEGKVLHRMNSGEYAGDTQRIAASPTTPAVLVQPNESTPDRSRIIVRPELLRQIGLTSSDPDAIQALDYAATNAPATLLAPRNPFGGNFQQILIGGPELSEHLARDIWVKLAPVTWILFRIDRWWPDPGQGGAR
jgi:hypothetical protein